MCVRACVLIPGTNQFARQVLLKVSPLYLQHMNIIQMIFKLHIKYIKLYINTKLA